MTLIICVKEVIESVTYTTLNIKYIPDHCDQSRRDDCHWTPAKVPVSFPDLNVTGKLPGQGGEKGHLEVIFHHLTGKETGNFQCEVDGADSQGHSNDFSKTLVIKEEDMTVSTVRSYIKWHLKTFFLKEEEMTLKYLVNTVKDMTRDKELFENSDL